MVMAPGWSTCTGVGVGTSRRTNGERKQKMEDNRRAILIGACLQASAQLVAAGKYGDASSPGYPVDDVARLTRMLTDELLHDAMVASAEFLPEEK
jgi:hypothetical protein